MKPLHILVIGTGMYTYGRRTEWHGTILGDCRGASRLAMTTFLIRSL
jgi:hypothetical protein